MHLSSAEEAVPGTLLKPNGSRWGSVSSFENVHFLYGASKSTQSQSLKLESKPELSQSQGFKIGLKWLSDYQKGKCHRFDIPFEIWILGSNLFVMLMAPQRF